MSLLLMHGADVHARDPRMDWTAIHHAAANGSSTLIELLHSAGAKIDDVEHRLGYTPLLLAASHGRREAVGALLSRGANAAHGNRLGRSALSIAAAIDDWWVVNLLLQSGADARQVCGEDRSAFEYAVARNSRLSALSLANSMGCAVDESLLGRSPLDYTTQRFFRRNPVQSGGATTAATAAGGGGQGKYTHDRDAEMRKLANLLGCKLSGNKTTDAYLVECEMSAFVGFDRFEGPVGWEDEDA
ncbi:ankyrin repeat-containing domain protein [Aspergillus pseudoustus]|uniref:Ankyrin repeat-containing domain protein n=1 Tax=Aspergillus pseudoustus TaxID=1810923 RepID=A0ABR4JEH9_9EURO